MQAAKIGPDLRLLESRKFMEQTSYDPPLNPFLSDISRPSPSSILRSLIKQELTKQYDFFKSLVPNGEKCLCFYDVNWLL